ncbi:MAG: hypothetical protein V7642_944 [Burkholderiales bacterium]
MTIMLHAVRLAGGLQLGIGLLLFFLILLFGRFLLGLVIFLGLLLGFAPLHKRVLGPGWRIGRSARWG